MSNLCLHHSSLTLGPSYLPSQCMFSIHLTNYRETSPVHYHISIVFALFSLNCSKGLPRIILKLIHFYGKLHVESKTALKKHTTILLLLLLLSCYVNHYGYKTAYNCEHIANKISKHTMAKRGL